jgi:hypothetical protein
MRVMGCIAAAFAAFFMFAAPASAKVLCGGLDARGKLMEPCSAKPAKRISKVPRKCPSGSFFDLGTWSCWKKCPDLYARGIKAVDKGQACERRKKFHYKPSSSQQTKGCPSGTAYGIYNGKLGCFACPTGTVLSPFSRGCVAKNMVANPAAPGKTAKLQGNPCKAGFLYVKDKCYACAKGYKLDIKDPSGIKACKRELPKFVPTTKVSAISCPKKDNQFFHVTDGGTCWSCPPFYARNSFRKIKGDKACASLGIDWQSPKYPEPGMFGLAGADEVVIDIVTNHRDKIDALITARAAALKSQLGVTAARDFAAQQWRIIRDDPQASPDLNYMVFMRMIAMANYNGRKPKADGELIKSFQIYT